MHTALLFIFKKIGATPILLKA